VWWAEVRVAKVFLQASKRLNAKVWTQGPHILRVCPAPTTNIAPSQRYQHTSVAHTRLLYEASPLNLNMTWGHALQSHLIAPSRASSALLKAAPPALLLTCSTPTKPGPDRVMGTYLIAQQQHKEASQSA
jgi:hypothetical protein